MKYDALYNRIAISYVLSLHGLCTRCCALCLYILYTILRRLSINLSIHRRAPRFCKYRRHLRSETNAEVLIPIRRSTFFLADLAKKMKLEFVTYRMQSVSQSFIPNHHCPSTSCLSTNHWFSFHFLPHSLSKTTPGSIIVLSKFQPQLVNSLTLGQASLGTRPPCHHTSRS